ncbi:hypothetical protein ACIBCM_18785 [Streptomyces sp. NPDC051018]|uniref:hypothetical protein n=1 Tax=Streptomyces sp. NPDC051018 TaxID=3365639 RepID=UPI0037A9C3F6
MLTIHTAPLLLPGGGLPPLRDGAVAVRGREIEAVGPYERLAADRPAARIRRWPGVITPGLLNPHGPELLERMYHPDPREAAELGTEPLTGDALAALAPDEVRWGASARRGIQRMLAHGTVAVDGTPRRPAVVDALIRAGLTVLPRPAEPSGPPSLDPLAGRSPADAFLTPLMPLTPLTVEGGRADFAVFGVADEEDLAARGAATCVVTVLAGRLVHRRR